MPGLGASAARIEDASSGQRGRTGCAGTCTRRAVCLTGLPDPSLRPGVIAGLLLLIVLTGIRAAGPAVGSAGPCCGSTRWLSASAWRSRWPACWSRWPSGPAGRRRPDGSRATLRGHVRRGSGRHHGRGRRASTFVERGRARPVRAAAARRRTPGRQRLRASAAAHLPPAGHPVNLSYLLYALIARWSILAAIVGLRDLRRPAARTRRAGGEPRRARRRRERGPAAGGRVRPFGASHARRRAGRDHRLLRGDGRQPGQSRSGQDRGRDTGRAAGQGGCVRPDPRPGGDAA